MKTDDSSVGIVIQAVDIQQHNDTDEDGQPYLLRVAQNICVVIEGISSSFIFNAAKEIPDVGVTSQSRLEWPNSLPCLRRR